MKNEPRKDFFYNIDKTKRKISSKTYKYIKNARILKKQYSNNKTGVNS